MFERFTEGARRVVVMAQEEARLLGHGWIGTEHLLLAMLAEGEGLARRALDDLGVDHASVVAQVRAVIPAGDPPAAGHIPFTPSAKRVLELSLREAMQLGDSAIATEHILLGVAREGEGLAAQMLAERGAGLDRIRRQLNELRPPVTTLRRPAVREGPTPHTWAGRRAAEAAIRRAAGEPVGSHHLLLGLLDDPGSMASKVLASFGVTAEDAAARIAELGPAGTTDESPGQAGARRMELRVARGRLELSVDDPELVEGLEDVVVTGADPAAIRFPLLWETLREAAGDVRRTLQGEPAAEAPAVEPAIPRTEWHPTMGGGFYAVLSRPEGLVGRLQTAVGVDSGNVRRVLAAWVARAGDLTGPDTECVQFSARVEEGPEGAFVVRDFTYGASGPPDWPRRPLAELLAFAADDLRVRHDD